MEPDADPKSGASPHSEATGADAVAWRDKAHAAQLPPEGDWLTWLFLGGRGAGKTRAGAEWIAEQADLCPRGRFALIAPTEHDLREVMIDGASGLLHLPNRKAPRYSSSRRRLEWDNGAIGYGFSSEEPERLRGPQFNAAWADEFCVWKHRTTTLSNLRFGLRLGVAPRLVVTTTPKDIASLRDLMGEPRCVVTRASAEVNAANLAASYIPGVRQIYRGAGLLRQEIDGELLPADGHMWGRHHFDEVRATAPAKFDRVFVAVDPPAGGEIARSRSACGIIVAGRIGRVAYVLADRSVEGLTPTGWASRVAQAASSFGAHAIVAESNQGGDMVRAVLEQQGQPCPVQLVRAHESKRARAQPVFALYELREVFHCGRFPDLEHQLIALGQGEGSAYDRADALVWAVRELRRDADMPQPRVRTL
jgi:phage terminase large subunit-like protein